MKREEFVMRFLNKGIISGLKDVVIKFKVFFLYQESRFIILDEFFFIRYNKIIIMVFLKSFFYIINFIFGRDIIGKFYYCDYYFYIYLFV